MIGTNLPGRVRNVSLAPSNGLMPLFEAVSNSIHAIEECGRAPEDGRIKIEIKRSAPHLPLDQDDKAVQGDIDAFTITDNGVGFDEPNFRSFRTLDSEHKVNKGGRGVGRLLWLKAFEAVSIESVFKDDDGKYKRRSFTFGAAAGVTGGTPESIDGRAQRRTTISLNGFRDRYRQQSYKTAAAIGAAIVEHCLWYFVRPGGTTRIVVEDGAEALQLREPNGLGASHRNDREPDL
jgi:hypothetical protein